MTQPLLRPPPNLQPRLKATSTFSSTSPTTSATSTPPQVSRASSQSRQSSPAHSVAPFDTSEKATAALVRRVLCPHAHAGTTEPRPIDELLPPLTSSNEIDLQLYAIIAIVVKELVHSWYGKITPDQEFVEEVVKIVAHCTRALEGRLRTVDIESLIFDEVPELIENHIIAYRISHQSAHSCLISNPRVIYHDLNPHPAFSPVPNPAIEATITEQSRNEAEYRQLLVQGALAVLLPTEDLENACLRTLVANVIGETILGNAVGGKACERWFIWASITKIVEAVKARKESQTTSGEEVSIDSRSRLEKFGLLSERGLNRSSSRSSRHSIRTIFWRILQYGYLTFIAIRFVVLGLVAASSRPPRHSSTGTSTSGGVKSSPMERSIQPPRPILDFKCFSLISVLLNLPACMPWLSGSCSLLQHHFISGPLNLGATDRLLDQYLSHLLTLQPRTLLPPLLSLTRQSLFPNSSFPPPTSPLPPSPQQISKIKHTTAASLLSLLPVSLISRIFGSREEALEEIGTELEVWEDGYLNRHLLYSILELVLVRVMPEFGEKGPGALMEGRVGGVENDV